MEDLNVIMSTIMWFVMACVVFYVILGRLVPRFPTALKAPATIIVVGLGTVFLLGIIDIL